MHAEAREKRGTGVPRMTRNQILAHIQDLITRGVLEAGAKLPTTNQLADEFEVSTATIDTVMAILQDRGVITGVRGGRRYVAGAPPSESTAAIPREPFNEHGGPEVT